MPPLSQRSAWWCLEAEPLEGEPQETEETPWLTTLTSSFVGYTVGFPGMSAYAAAKAGLVGLAQVIATEYGARGVRANAVLPGGTDTPSNVANAPGAAPETRAFVEGLHAVKRMATPMEIARAVLHLASDDSSFITGTALLVDGGVSIART